MRKYDLQPKGHQLADFLDDVTRDMIAIEMTVQTMHRLIADHLAEIESLGERKNPDAPFCVEVPAEELALLRWNMEQCQSIIANGMDGFSSFHQTFQRDYFRRNQGGSLHVD
ncbi:MAG: hypothetical protein CML24_14655 [Rhizobiales bacterium]|nr:hypothetical protein [Hyphomicrobiales bacterium]|tara:strand:+ start:4871 stop:5206 length:336 start_codon:yes stop_codon:yes gene_type:complete